MDDKSSLRQRLYASESGVYDNVPCQIEEGLYLGSFNAAKNKPRLKELNITHILTMGHMSPAHPYDFKYEVFPIQDTENTRIVNYFDECFDFIDEAIRMGGCALVHCRAGISRSVTVVVAYLMKRYGMNLYQALSHVRCKRPQANPNPGFILQLKDFEQSLNEVTPKAFDIGTLKCIIVPEVKDSADFDEREHFEEDPMEIDDCTVSTFEEIEAADKKHELDPNYLELASSAEKLLEDLSLFQKKYSEEEAIAKAWDMESIARSHLELQSVKGEAARKQDKTR